MTAEHENGERIVLDVLEPTRAEAPVVLFAHGLASDRDGFKATGLREVARREGLGFARFDFRGHGESDGTLAGTTLTRLLEDLRLALEATTAALGARPTVLVGSSLGGFVASWHAALDAGPVTHQVLLAPAFRIAERTFASLDARTFARWRRTGTHRFPADGFTFDLGWDVVEDAARYPHSVLTKGTTVPTTILHGTRDQAVPIQVSREFVEDCSSASLRLIELDGADHRLSGRDADIAAHVLRAAEAAGRQEPVLS